MFCARIQYVCYLKVIPNLIYCKNLISVITLDKIDLTPWPCYIKELAEGKLPFLSHVGIIYFKGIDQ